ncbi:IS3 family transposase [Lactiplantibacillus carotarum]|uniref:IS3 family transposase n=1 Tax=Lactiplantibacillus carotarum TaxID=2993456 RepID=UPI00384F2131
MPIESFFHLLKTEYLGDAPPCKDLSKLEIVSKQDIEPFNHYRISLKTKGMSPYEYRKHALTT